MSNAHWRVLGTALCLIALMGVSTPAPAKAQGFLHKLKEKVEKKAHERIDEREDEAAQAAVDKTDHVIACVVTDVACIQRAQAAGEDVSITDSAGHPVSSRDSAAALASAGAPAASSSAPGTGAWVNYDFVPGDRALFVGDFTADNVGDFPRRLTFIKGNMEVAEWNGARWLRGTSSGSRFAIPLPDTLPDRFTLEFDYAGGNPSAADFVSVYFSDDGTAQHLVFSPPGNDPPSAGIYGVAVTPLEPSDSTVRHARIMADGRYVKVYVGSQRVSNVPNATLGRSKAITFSVDLASPDMPVFIGNIRVAAGGRDLYDALAKDGRVATHGILFDVGSATIRPESTPTLKAIGQMLEQHPELQLSIEGHTDNTGNAAKNESLSEQRAAAVKQYLITSYHVAAARLTTKGWGASKPVASNDTPEGRQQNRRVELVKM